MRKIETALQMKSWDSLFDADSPDKVLAGLTKMSKSFFKDKKGKMVGKRIKDVLNNWKAYNDDLARPPQEVFENFIDNLAYSYYEKYIFLHGRIQSLVWLVDPKNIVFPQNWFRKIANVLEQGKGLIIAFGKFGGYELLPIILSTQGLGISEIRSFSNPNARKVFSDRANLMGNENHFDYINAYDLDAALTALEDHKIVLMPIDDFEMESPTETYADFLGKSWPAGDFIDLLHNESSAPVFYISIRRLSLDFSRKPNYLLKFYENIQPEIHKNCLELLSPEILRYPEQWEGWINPVVSVKRK